MEKSILVTTKLEPRHSLAAGSRCYRVMHDGDFPGLAGLWSDVGEGLGYFGLPVSLLSAPPDQTGRQGGCEWPLGTE